MTLPVGEIDDDFFQDGKMFDGSSIAGWKGINESDMILLPEDETAVLDPFTDVATLNLRCNIVEPTTMQGYERDPRSVALRAEEYLKSTGIADSALFGPEPEFFVFDSVQWKSDMSGAMYNIYSEEAAWVSADEFEKNNIGHRPGVKGGYFPVPPVDSLHDLRGAMCSAMEQMGLEIEVHHHEVGTAGQCEIGVGANTLTKKADEVQILKYCVHNVAHAYGKTATFMPKPLIGDNGSGMHVHMSLAKNGKNLFAGDEYAGLSEEALFYIGGVIKHARALNAFTNRVSNPKARRIETRFPDPSANPYLCFAALMMAGLDGIKNKIHPGDAMDKDLYDLPAEEAKDIPTVAHTLTMALDALEADHEFLTQGDVFTKDMLDGYIELKRSEVERLNMTPHPVEFDMYYSC